MSVHRNPATAHYLRPGVLTRRRFLQLLGATAGSGAVASAMGALGYIPVSAQTEPPKLDGSGNALDNAIITASHMRDPQLVAKLDAVAGRVL